MAPKVEISEKTLSQLVKDHLEKQSEDGAVKKHVRKHGVGYAKLVAAIGALTVAINGYAALQKGNMQLAKENRVLFQAIASKVNHMAKRMAYVEGRLEGLKPVEAAEAVEKKIRPLESKPGVLEKIIEKVEVRTKAITRPPDHLFMDLSNEENVTYTMSVEESSGEEAAGEESPVAEVAAMDVNAYEQLPEDLSELMQVQEQMQP